MRNTFTPIAIIYVILVFTVMFQSCAPRAQNTAQLREAQKDTVINASFFGFKLGESMADALARIDTLRQDDVISAIDTGAYHSNEYYDDLLDIIQSLPISYTIKFEGKLTLKHANDYEDVKINTTLGFRNDSLYTILVIPRMSTRCFEKENVIETYQDKYGDLTYTYSFTRPIMTRRYITGTGYSFDQIQEVSSYDANLTVWRFRDADIYLASKTENTTVFKFNESDFNRELLRIPYDKKDDTDYICRHIKERLLFTRGEQQSTLNFIAYRNALMHARDSATLAAEGERSLKESDKAQQREDSLRRAAGRQDYSNQDI